MPGKESLPSTVRRSSQAAQETWIKTHDAAVREYGEGQRAHRTAFASLKHRFERIGDRWERKPGGRKGPSDAQAARHGAPARRGGKTAGGVDANASKQELYDVAKRLDVPGRSAMSKNELVNAIQKANRRKTSRSRGR